MRTTLQVLGSWLIFGEGKPDVEVSDRKKKLRKLKESAWKCIYYLSAEILAMTSRGLPIQFTSGLGLAIRYGRRTKVSSK